MDMRSGVPLPGWDGSTHNFVFLGEAGCGKSEIAVNLALRLGALGGKPVHFFDLDMTKPLFRSREVAEELEKRGVSVHFEEQFMDAPTTVGGPELLLRRSDCYTVLDVGGDYIGARSVGQYAPWFRKDFTAVYYVVNPFRPWSDTSDRIDLVLRDILSVTHLTFSQLRLIANPNLGPDTTAEEFLRGRQELQETVVPYAPIEFYCAEANLAPAVSPAIPEEIFPLELYFQYPWNQ